MNWLILSLIAMVCWGIWGLLSKMAIAQSNWHQVFVASSFVSLSTTLILYSYFRPAINVRSPGFLYAILAGAAGSMAVVAFYMALVRGNASIIVPLTALYPAITIILSYLILRERTTPTQTLGIFLAIIAILLISIK